MTTEHRQTTHTEPAPFDGAGATPGTTQVAPLFRELSEPECQQRLANATMGRVAWNSGGEQHILPVSFGMHAGMVVFRTSPYGALAHLQKPSDVAFEIDHTDQACAIGWSVVVQGRAQAVVQRRQLDLLWAGQHPVPWAPGTRNVFISITPHTIRGRQVRAPEPEENRS